MTECWLVSINSIIRAVYRGAVFADATDFDKCVALWMHALDIKQKNLKNTPVAKDVLRFAQVSNY